MTRVNTGKIRMIASDALAAAGVLAVVVVILGFFAYAASCGALGDASGLGPRGP